MKGEAICAACDERTSLGLSLAGITEILEWTPSDDRGELVRWFRSMEESRMQIIILSPEASEAISDELLQRRMEGRTIPLVVVLPVEGKDKMAQDLIRRAIGMDVEGKEALK